LRILGFIIALVYWNSLHYEYSSYAVFMLIVGACMMYPDIIKKGAHIVSKRLFN
jgi:hypothetical protein